MNRPILLNGSFLKSMLLSLTLLFCSNVSVAKEEVYDLDIKGMHSAIQFRIKHLGYSWLLGRFDNFDGWFSGDRENPSTSKVEVTIATNSVNSNHAERDKHLRSPKFLDVEKYPESTFVSTKVVDNGDKTGTITGDLTLHGVTKQIQINTKFVGDGKDPWGGYRAGFEGTTTLKLADFGITYNLGPASTHVEMSLYVEGIRR